RDRKRPDAVQEARRQTADVYRLVRSGRAAAGYGRLLRGRDQDDGWTGEDAGVLPLLPRAGHGPLRRRTGTEPVRSPDGARAVDREGRRAGQDDRVTRGEREGGS